MLTISAEGLQIDSLIQHQSASSSGSTLFDMSLVGTFFTTLLTIVEVPDTNVSTITGILQIINNSFRVEGDHDVSVRAVNATMITTIMKSIIAIMRRYANSCRSCWSNDWRSAEICRGR